MRILNENRKKFMSQRGTFIFIEAILLFLAIFFLMVLIWSFLPLLIVQTSPYFGLFFHLFRAIIIVIITPLILEFSHFLKRKLGITNLKTMPEGDLSPRSRHLKLYKVSKRNYKYQLLYGILIYFFLFLPTLTLTAMVAPQLVFGQLSSLQLYLFTNNFSEFLLISIVIQISIALTIETVFRGFLTKRGSENYNATSAVMISSIYFGLSYILPLNILSFILFLEMLLIGIVLSLILLRRKWLFPCIIAQTINNFVMSYILWSYFQGIQLQTIFLLLYLPLLIIGVILFIWQFSRIIDSLKLGLKTIFPYFKLNPKIKETGTDMAFRFFIDVASGALLFFLGLLVAV